MRNFMKILAIIWMGLILGAASAQAQSEEYLLGPQDVLLIRVGHFDPLLGMYVAWTDLNGEYVVAPDGTLGLPLAGRIVAEGKGAATIAEEIATAMSDRLVSQNALQVAVDIISFRPIYVLGAVRTPGSYPYAPGMTVLQAIGLAGGPSQGAVEYQRNTRTALGSLGNYEVLNLALLRRLATEARLSAEIEGLVAVQRPPELEGVVVANQLMTQERAIFAARNAALASALSQLDGLEVLLQRQIAQLNEQVTLRERQLELVTEELANATDLVARGLTVAGRGIELESRLADQEIRLLELFTARLNAEQRLNEAGRERLDLVNTRTREVAEELLIVRSDIAELRIKMRTEAALYAEATRHEDGFVQMEGLGAPEVELTRQRAEPVLVQRSDLLQPGDVLELIIPLPGATGSLAPTLSELQ